MTAQPDAIATGTDASKGEGERFFRAIFENSGTGMALVDRNGRPVECNPAFLDLLGIAHENGLINEENVARPDAKKLKAAATELSSTFPKEDVILYFSTLVSQDPDTWGALADLTTEPVGKDR